MLEDLYIGYRFIIWVGVICGDIDLVEVVGNLELYIK